LSGKTGGGRLTDNEYIMWLVGYVEKDGQPYFYALNFKTDNFNKASQARFEITKDILKELKLIE
jgi:beta-lactamase class D